MRKSMRLSVIIFCYVILHGTISAENSLEMVIQAPHAYGISALAFSPDGEFLATGSLDNQLKIWRVSDGVLLRTLYRHTGSIGGIAWKADSSGFFSAGGNLIEWSPSGEVLKEIKPEKKELSYKYLVLDPQGRFLLVGGIGLGLRYFPRADLEAHFRQIAKNTMTHSLKVTNTGDIILEGGFNYRSLYNWKGENLWTREERNGAIFVEILPDDKRFLSSYGEKYIGLFDIETGEKLESIRLPDETYRKSIAIHPSGTYAFVSTSKGSHLIDLADFSLAASVRERPFRRIDGAGSFSPDGTTGAFGGLQLMLQSEGTGGTRYKTLGESDMVAEHFTLSPDGEDIYISNEYGVRRWKLKGELHSSYTSNTLKLRDYCQYLSSNNTLAAIQNRRVLFLDPKTGNIVNSSVPGEDNERLSTLHVDRTGTLLAAKGYYNVYIYNEKGELLRKFDVRKQSDSWINSIVMDPSGRLLVVNQNDGHTILWSSKGESLYLLNEHVVSARSIFDSFGKRVYIGGLHGKIMAYDTQSGELIENIQLDSKGYISDLALNSRDQILAIGNDEGEIFLYSLDEGRVIEHYQNGASVRQVAFSSDDKQLIWADSNSTTVLNRENGKRYTLVLGDNRWIAFNNDGYFDASRNGGSLLVMSQETKSYSIDQFALRNNRPDRLFANMGFDNSELIAHFEAQYEKRLRRTGYRESDLNQEIVLPEINIEEAEKEENRLAVRFEARSEGAELAWYQIYVNGVPQFASTGKEISGNSAVIDEQIHLTPGNNRIELACSNQAGIESLREVVQAEGPVKRPSKLYYLGFGVSNYRDPTLNLAYAHKDARDLKALFQTFEGRNYASVMTRTYLNEEVTREAFREAMGFLEEAEPEDTVVVFIAGHGIHERDAEATYYYLTHGADPQNLAETAAPFDLVEGLLDGIAARKKLFLMDTCESGEAEEGQEARYWRVAGARGLAPRTSRGLGALKKSSSEEGGAPVSRERSYLLERNRYIYNNLARRTGAIIFSSSRGEEFSYERDDLKNGLFTEAILKALTNDMGDLNRDGRVSIAELRHYVPRWVSEWSDGLQNPTVDRDNLYMDFTF